MMEVFRTSDGSVTKFIHEDGSETAIKRVPSQSTFIDRTAGTIETKFSDRNKYSVFISSSTGCYLACPFCHLTIKDCQYKRLDISQVLDNLKEAITDELEHRPELKDCYVKLCWMGMGDALNNPTMVDVVSIHLMDWIMYKGYAKGLDSVDLSTVAPKVYRGWVEKFANLNSALAKFPLNPDSANVEQAELATHQKYTDRSIFRLFYSLHSAIQTTRDKMAPKTMPLADAIPLLHDLESRGVSVLLHQVFVEGLNDSMDEVTALVDLLKQEFDSNELRVLRYNFCDKSPYREWSEIIPQLGTLLSSHEKLKVQTSAGTEVQAACGQFLVAIPKSLKKKEHNEVR